MGDILILAILTLMVYFGYKKGFLRTLTGVLSLVASWILAILLCSPVTAVLETIPLPHSKIVSVILIFVLARMFIYALMKLCGLIRKLPIIGTFDGLLGAVFGLVRGVLIVYLLAMVVSVYVQTSGPNYISDSLNQSEFAKVVYKSNVFLDFLNKD